MDAKQVIKQTYELCQTVMSSYVGDFDDAELLNRPGEGCNHLAWQLGHLIASEGNLLNMVAPGAAIELPEGFAEKHGKENVSSDSPGDFCSKEEYMSLFAKNKEATFAALDAMSAEDLDKPGPDAMKDFCPTVGSMFVLIGTHLMMHAGQAVPVRRKLEKPIVM